MNKILKKNLRTKHIIAKIYQIFKEADNLHLL